MGELLFHTAAYCLVNFLNPFFCLTLFSLHTIQNINITPSSLFQVLFFHISIITLSNYFSNQYFVTIIKQHTINIYLLYFVIISGKFNSKETILNNNTIVFSIYIFPTQNSLLRSFFFNKQDNQRLSCLQSIIIYFLPNTYANIAKKTESQLITIASIPNISICFSI